MHSFKKLPLIIVLVLLCVLVHNNVAHAEVEKKVENPFGKYQDVDDDGIQEVRCTWFAWQQVYENKGIALPAWGDGGKWLSGAQASGYHTGSTPKEGSVAVWTSVNGSYGHVAYVVSASGDTFTINEGGRIDLDHTASEGVAYNVTITNPVNTIKPGDDNLMLQGFIYPYDDIPPVISYNADYHLKGGEGYFYFTVKDNETQYIPKSGVNPDSVKLMLWQYGQEESQSVEVEAQPVNPENSEGGYKADVDLSADESLYFAKIVAADNKGNISEAYIRKYKPFPFFTVDKSSSTGVYIVKKGEAAVHRAPYDKINNKTTRNGTLQEGAKVEVVGTYINSYEHEWYQIADGRWVYSNNLVKLYSLSGILQDICSLFEDPHMYFVNNQALHTGAVYNNSGAKAPGMRAANTLSDDGDIPYEEGYTIRFSTRSVTTEESYYGPDSGVPLRTIVFHGNSGFVDIESIQVYEGNTYGELPAADRLGYTFTGWFTDPEAGEQVLPTDTCTQDLDLYAHWVKKVTASGSCGDYLTWELDEEGLLKIVGSGSMTSAPWYTDGYCPNITEVSLPEGLDSICNNAFKDSNLLTVTFPQSLRYIGRDAFNGCVLLEGALTIPEGVARIEDGSFESCAGITELTIPDSVTYIDKNAFADCEGITELTIPNSVTYIGGSAFAGFTGLKNLTCPGNLSYVVSNTAVFSGCTGLESIKLTGEGGIPGYSSFNAQETPWYISSEAGTELTIEIEEGITWIGNSAFRGCSNITSINIPETVTGIEEYAFCDCSSLTGPLPGPLSYIGRSAFEGCSSMTGSIVLTDEITGIGENTFKDCVSLEGVLTIPDSVTYIDKNAFAGCEGITELTIPDSVTDIRGSAFAGFTGLKKLTCPGNLSYVVSDTAVFSGCTGLESIKFTGEGGIPGYTPYNAQETPWYISSEAGTELTIEIEEGITGIGSSAFHGCSNIISINIPETVTSIEQYAFYDCSSLTGSLELSNNITDIGRYAFSGCASLTELTIPDGINVLDGAFENCSGLKKVKMPIDFALQSQFIGCSNVEEIEYSPGITGRMVDRKSQDSSDYHHVYYVRTLEYQSSESLKTVIFNEGVVSIGENAYGNFGQLENVKFASTIENIGSNAFTGHTATEYYGYKDSYCETYAGDSGLVFIPLNYPMIANENPVLKGGEQYAFSAKVYTDIDTFTDNVIWSVEGEQGNNTAISQNGVLSVDEKEYADSLSIIASHEGVSAAINIPVERLAPDFDESDMLLPGSLTKIEEEAFMNMSAITVKCPDTLVEIGAGAFRNCRSLRNIYIPAATQTIADDAFDGCTNLIIWGVTGSYAETYAEEKGIGFAEIDVNE